MPDDLAPPPPPAYGSFGTRLRALFIDATIMLGGALVILILTALTESIPGSGRVAIAALFALFVLYEPLMVWRTGGTVGHRRANLRVVHDASGRNPGFLRALARFLIKSALGVISFVTMALTRRHQAVHDALTGTTVRIRDLAAAREEDVRWERIVTEPATAPSRWRRLVVIAGHLAAAFVAFATTLGVALSDACLADDRCSAGGRVLNSGLGLVWFGTSAWIIIAGWRGRLWGCRSRPAPADVAPVDLAPPKVDTPAG